MTQELIVMVGIPGSGKSTWIKQEVERLESEHWTTCVISRDNVRQSLLRPGDMYFDREKEVFNEFIRQINEAMELGIDYVFVDATHINFPSRKKLLSRLKPDSNTKLVFQVVGTTLETALKRNAQREGFARVPDSAIINMAKSSSVPTLEELKENSYGFRTSSVRFRGNDDKLRRVDYDLDLE